MTTKNEKSDILLKVILALLGGVMGWQAKETGKLNDTVGDLSVTIAAIVERETNNQRKTDENTADIKQIKIEFNNYVLTQSKRDNQQDHVITRTASMVGIIPDKLKIEDE